jgi:hypothetical protein
MLKTQTKEENKFLKRILPQYFHYLKENPHSLLVRILGNLSSFLLLSCFSLTFAFYVSPLASLPSPVSFFS